MFATESHNCKKSTVSRRSDLTTVYAAVLASLEAGIAPTNLINALVAGGAPGVVVAAIVTADVNPAAVSTAIAIISSLLATKRCAVCRQRRCSCRHRDY